VKREIGIKAYHWALGDSLQFSTLPEIYSNMGYDVYLLKDAKFKNEEIKDLVWNSNPYIKGEKVIEWELGDIPGRIYENKTDNFIKNWEVAHGLEPLNDFPKIYYNPSKLSGVDVLIDISAQSVIYDKDKLLSSIKKHLKENFKKSDCLLITSDKFPVIDDYGFNLIKVKDLRHYADLINSCSAYLSCSSGGHSLAASIRHLNKNFKQVCFLPEKIDSCGEYLPTYDYLTNTKSFIYPLVEYVKI